MLRAIPHLLPHFNWPYRRYHVRRLAKFQPAFYYREIRQKFNPCRRQRNERSRNIRVAARWERFDSESNGELGNGCSIVEIPSEQCSMKGQIRNECNLPGDLYNLRFFSLLFLNETEISTCSDQNWDKIPFEQFGKQRHYAFPFWTV